MEEAYDKIRDGFRAAISTSTSEAERVTRLVLQNIEK